MEGINWWREPAFSQSSNELSWADVQVAPAMLAQVEESLKLSGIDYFVMIQDMQPLIEEQMIPAGNDWFDAYHNYSGTVQWLKDLAAQYSSIADFVTVGKTHEGRDIVGLHITGKRAELNATKPGIFNDGGIHAREWISPATVSYLAFNFLEKYGKDAHVTSLVDAIDFTFVPIFNADGYEYTWQRDRMWRKTRMPNSGSSCVGTDPCRNAATGWGGGGSDSNPCGETYRGKKAFDQPEVLAVANYVKALGNVKYYNNFHSYSQLWMGPWGYTFSTPPAADFAKQQEVGKIAAQTIQATHGLKYAQGPVASTIYQASGIMCDEIYKASGVILSYTCELRDTGAYGFLLPPSQIKPQGEEIFAATLAIADYVVAHQHEL